jgi:hypothetical protein
MATHEVRQVVVDQPAPPVRRRRLVERREPVPVLVSPGMILGALGALGVAVSLFLSWRDPSLSPSDVPVSFLWDRNTSDVDPSLLIVLIPIAVILVVGAITPLGAGLRLFGGAAMLVVAGLFAYQLNRWFGGPRGNGDISDVLGTGFYVGTIGGLLAFASGLVATPWAARRESVDSEVVDDRVV